MTGVATLGHDSKLTVALLIVIIAGMAWLLRIAVSASWEASSWYTATDLRFQESERRQHAIEMRLTELSDIHERLLRLEDKMNAYEVWPAAKQGGG